MFNVEIKITFHHFYAELNSEETEGKQEGVYPPDVFHIGGKLVLEEFVERKAHLDQHFVWVITILVNFKDITPL